MLLHDSVAQVATAFALLPVGAAVRRSELLPRWVGSSAIVVPVVNLAFMPSMLFSDNPAEPYSAVRWAITANIPALLLYRGNRGRVVLLRLARPLRPAGPDRVDPTTPDDERVTRAW